jgi:hypothetical protein
VKQDVESAARELLDPGDPPHAHRLAKGDLLDLCAASPVDDRHRDRIRAIEIAVPRFEAAFDHLAIPGFEDVEWLGAVRKQADSREREQRHRLSEIDAIRGHAGMISPVEG